MRKEVETHWDVVCTWPLFLFGFFVFSTCHRLLVYFFKYILHPRYGNGGVYHTTEKCVSSIQAVLSVIVGIVIASNCQGNIMTDTHWLTNSYAWFGMPYFYYDTVAMYLSHYYLHPHLSSLPVSHRIWHYIVNTKALLIHHFVLPLIFFPSILFFRKNLGDFFVGVFYQIELAIPFISLRNVLAQLQLKDTPYYIAAGLLMIVAFAVCRVFVFPYLYWKYAQYANISIWSVPSTIPLKCNIGCLVILVLQVYWLYVMVRGAVKVFYKMYMKSQNQKSKIS
ncbi:hypothetical protein FSP39_022178 [Pinctada imbricata]|uniref:TLC domain-containing protein n=1 Tax=Pinctada imbricata TaxID=66713 RepID=A0AA88XG98_PINIB|nr:hypothetical protein FSP39_022178 [Pinctada imbricata]